MISYHSFNDSYNESILIGLVRFLVYDMYSHPSSILPLQVKQLQKHLCNPNFESGLIAFSTHTLAH